MLLIKQFDEFSVQNCKQEHYLRSHEYDVKLKDTKLFLH